MRGVVLLDALYGGAEDYAALADRRRARRALHQLLPRSAARPTPAAAHCCALRAGRSAQTRVAQLDAADFPAHVAPRPLIIAEGHVAHRDMPEGYMTPRYEPSTCRSAGALAVDPCSVTVVGTRFANKI